MSSTANGLVFVLSLAEGVPNGRTGTERGSRTRLRPGGGGTRRKFPRRPVFTTSSHYLAVVVFDIAQSSFEKMVDSPH